MQTTRSAALEISRYLVPYCVYVMEALKEYCTPYSGVPCTYVPRMWIVYPSTTRYIREVSNRIYGQTRLHSYELEVYAGIRCTYVLYIQVYTVYILVYTGIYCMYITGIYTYRSMLGHYLSFHQNTIKELNY